MSKRASLWLALLSLFMGVVCCFGQDAAVNRPHRRGRLLRTEVRKTERKDGFECQMLPAPGSFPLLQFTRKTLLTHHEVQVFEVVKEVARENKGEGITIRGTVDYEVIPGEVMEGEWTTREELVDNGPFAEADFEIFGQRWRTDQDGQIVDTAQALLRPFDDLRTMSTELTITHASMGTQKMTISRNLLRRVESVSTDRTASVDLLEMLGLDFLQHRLPGREGLTLEVSAPATASAGDVVKITVTASNGGNQQVSSLLGRSFSKEAWGNGRMFYLGGLKPGEKRSFTRLLTVPEDIKAGACFITVGFWDLLGTLPVGQAGKIRIDLK
ncbi:MAG: hypothetical protein GX574_07100 [Lentisphaerae bacterium]|nr:hypothetical protein [Lentisphaerota bacterium]HQL86420.1 hypothetical protein [Lentisphaeria bacterium]